MVCMYCVNMPGLNMALLTCRIFTPVTPHRASYWSCPPALQTKLNTHGRWHLSGKHLWVSTTKIRKNACIYTRQRNELWKCM